MEQLRPETRKRFLNWAATEIVKAVALLDQDARDCGNALLGSEEINFILLRLPNNYFFNRHKREIALAMQASPYHLDVSHDLSGVVERSAEHWIAMASSSIEDAQEDAKIFATSLRLRNAYLWFLVGKKAASIHSDMEADFWRIKMTGFKRMALSEPA